MSGPEEKKTGLSLALAGVAVQVVGFVANALTLSLDSPRLASAFALLISLGAAVVVWGCIRLARAKGHAWYLGFLGILSFVGVAIVHFALRDRRAP